VRVPVAPLRFFFLILCSGAVAAPVRLAEEAWIRGVYTGLTPRAVELPAGEAWQKATALAAEHHGAFAVVGAGRSMLPLYQPGTILVLAPADYTSLRRGQTAVYRNNRDRLVAHVLIAKARDGWRAAGLNNRWHDMEPLVADKLLGVVVAAFRPMKSGKPLALAALRAPTAAFLVD
jgi:hypothetical protein